jgi:AraC-like DNA-binding protein
MGKSAVEPVRTNYFSIVWIESGAGQFWANASQHSFRANQLLFFVPYQRIRFAPSKPVKSTLIHFHANFLCVETFHAETGCSGMLFNDSYGSPVVTVGVRAKTEVVALLDQIRRELDERSLGYREASLACMKLLLIAAARLKTQAAGVCSTEVTDFRHPLLGPLRDLIEKNYRVLHAPSDYAALLHVTAKTLGRCVREHLGKTLTDLIRERILTHAKWELLHTLKPVKEIATEAGFEDELYFSRLFKKATGVSPTFFREFETEIRGGSNLSMPLAQAPILIPPGTTDDS